MSRIGLVLTALVFTMNLNGQLLSPSHYRLMNQDSVIVQNELKNNSIFDIESQGDSTIWLGTGQGLAVLRDSLSVLAVDTLTLLSGEQVIFQDGIVAIAAQGDRFFCAGVTDDGETPMGSGFYLTDNALNENLVWSYYPQPVDDVGDSLVPYAGRTFRALPVTTDRLNITYDAAFTDGYLWVTSWAGGLRRLDLNSGTEWDRVPLPKDSQSFLVTCADSAYSVDNLGNEILNNYYLNPRDPRDNGNHNHKAFSVTGYGDTVWVGTANGINRGLLGEDGCIDWDHYSYPLDGLSGNFVVSIAHQYWDNERTVWAVTLNADSPGEERGLSYTADDSTWHTVPSLLGERIYNVHCKDSYVFAGSENGLWVSPDAGQTWAKYPPAADTTYLSTDEILSEDVFSVLLDTRDYYGRPVVWMGTSDGLGRSEDIYGGSWNIYRTDYPGVYAYPNPFSPNVHNLLDGDGYVRFHIDEIASYTIEVGIYNFALERVYHGVFDRRDADSGTLKWNGRDENGRLVDNGVYFVNLAYSETSNQSRTDHWIKLIVVK